ncbi:MAG TPA: geranylgeranylglycerol-phosphate geranylgeranyltransferase [Methanospirillum sp.]|uniref:geranylgeranylglycerol-phosphate geranylgeranyltransferase n=1 Tax=Methanospirillum sp. TaxID=45200 RepID=UPI002CD6A577|nr:geranylgeranylglycerol-phosphate geranylgeranyltransferase [Methanospirillum sp.]HWQ63196.1 geranylgeranylglycerol-phosphate geranylgeranyltransferase [Methanospirillum sp.]
MKPAAFIRIIRPLNAVMAGFAGVLAFVIATGTLLPSVLIIFFMVLLITAAGNVINDYHDAAIDAINRPDRPIPSGEISQRAALVYSVLLFLIGNAIGIAYAPLPLIIIAALNSVLLWGYASYLKVMPLLGNLAVSYLSASIFLFGGALEGWEGVIANLPVAGACFGVILSRELIKDAEDMQGDKAHGARTLPILYGLKSTVLVAVASAIFGVIISLLLYFRWGNYYLVGIIPVDIIIFYGAFRAFWCSTSEEIKESHSSLFIKVGMFASLLIFLISAVLFR